MGPQQSDSQEVSPGYSAAREDTVSKANLPRAVQQESRGVAAWVQHHPLVTYFALTYLLTWSLDLAPVKDPHHSIEMVPGLHARGRTNHELSKQASYRNTPPDGIHN